MLSFARRYRHYSNYSNSGEDLAAAVFGLLFFLGIMFVFCYISDAGGIKNAAKKIGNSLKKTAQSGANLADQATQKVANKVAKVMHEAKTEATQSTEKLQLEKQANDLEIKLLKQKIADLQNQLKKENLK